MRGEPTTRTGGLVDGLRSMPLFRQLVPMEAMICWPLPLRQRQSWDGRTAVYFKLLLAGFRRPESRGQPTTIFPPFAMITLNYANGAPAEWVDLRYSRPWPTHPPLGPVGEHPHAAIADLTVGEYRAQRDRLFELFDELAEAQLAGERFDRQDEFGEVFGRLAEPGLVPYYRSIAPRFVERFLGPGPSAGSDA